VSQGVESFNTISNNSSSGTIGTIGSNGSNGSNGNLTCANDDNGNANRNNRHVHTNESDPGSSWGTLSTRVATKLKQLLLTSGPAYQKEMKAILALKRRFQLAEQMDRAVDIAALVKLEQVSCSSPYHLW
jgi:hypothetical protein